MTTRFISLVTATLQLGPKSSMKLVANEPYAFPNPDLDVQNALLTHAVAGRIKITSGLDSASPVLYRPSPSNQIVVVIGDGTDLPSTNLHTLTLGSTVLTIGTAGTGAGTQTDATLLTNLETAITAAATTLAADGLTLVSAAILATKKILLVFDGSDVDVWADCTATMTADVLLGSIVKFTGTGTEVALQQTAVVISHTVSAGDVTRGFAVIDTGLTALEATTEFDDAAYVGIRVLRPGTLANGTMTLIAVSTDTQTVTIGSRVYTWVTTLSGAANEVLIGATAAEDATNLTAAINGTSGEGTTYGEGTVPHALVTAAIGTAVVATATLTSDGTAPSDGDTVTIGNKTYTFKDTLTPTEGQVLIGISAATALDNLKAAVNHTGTPDTDYKCAAAHTQVTATTNTNTTQVFDALVAGAAGNLFGFSEAGTHTSVSGAFFTGGMDKVVVTAIAHDTTNNDLATTETMTSGSFASSTLDNGTANSTIVHDGSYAIHDSRTVVVTNDGSTDWAALDKIQVLAVGTDV